LEAQAGWKARMIYKEIKPSGYSVLPSYKKKRQPGYATEASDKALRDNLIEQKA